MPRPRILVVDDEEAICRCLRNLLRARADVVATTRAEEALRWLADGQTFDVILCDYQMPHIDGMRFFRALGPGSGQLVFLTGSVYTDELAKLGCPILPKPFTLPELHQLVAAVTDRSGSRSP